MRRFLILALLAGSFFRSAAADIWVAVNGDDQAAGTQAAPLATVGAALRKARELRRLHDPSAADGIRIFIRGGEYPLPEPVLVRPEDSGVVIMAAPGERPVLS